MTKKILITGACAVTARSVARALKRDFKNRIWICGVGIFENEYSAHEEIYDLVIKTSHCTSKAYPNQIYSILSNYKFDGVLVIPEIEVLVWAKEKFPAPYHLPTPQFIKKVSDKKELNLALRNTKLAIKSIFFDSNNMEMRLSDWREFPCWVRPCDFGISSGRGAAKFETIKQIKDWVSLYPRHISWQVSEYVKGRNVAISLLFRDSQLLNYGMYERLRYFGEHLFQSGVSGNISKGKIFTDTKLLADVLTALDEFSDFREGKVNGFLTLDLLLAENDLTKITEINVRPTAPVEAYSLVGNHIIRNWVESISGDTITESDRKFDKDKIILRDIDGKLLVVQENANKFAEIYNE